MQYNWEKVVAPGETIQIEFGISTKYQRLVFIVNIIISVILAFALIYMGITIFILGLLYWYYLKKSKHYAFTNKRIILVDSFIGTNITTVDYNQITDIEINQSFLDQVGGWGTIILNTAGTNAPEINFVLIDNPEKIKQTLDTIRDSSGKIVSA